MSSGFFPLIQIDLFGGGLVVKTGRLSCLTYYEGTTILLLMPQQTTRPLATNQVCPLELGFVLVSFL